MKYQNLRNSVQISNIGLGCMGMSEFYGSTNESESKKIIDAAIVHGINFFDTADVYGFGHNEKLVGSVIAKHPQKRDELVIATKCGLVRDKNDVRKRAIDNSYDYIVQCCTNSTERLMTYIDLYYLHRVHQPSIIEAMKAMSSLLIQGKIRAVGLSEANVETIKIANDTLLQLTNGAHGISAVQTEFSVLSREVENNGVLEFCNANNITFVAYSPISRGLLTSQLSDVNQLESQDSRNYLPRFVGDNFKKNKLFIETVLVPLAEKNSCTLAQICLAWLLSKPGVVPIPGTRHLNYLLENIATVDIVLSQDDNELIEESLNDFAVHGERYPAEDMKIYGLK